MSCYVSIDLRTTCRFNGYRFSLNSPATSLFCSYEVINILIELDPRSFWATTTFSVAKLLRPFRHKLTQWVTTKFPTDEFFELKVDCQIPMNQWDVASVARFYMDAGYLTFSGNSNRSYIRLQFPNRSIGKAVAATIEEPLRNGLANQEDVGLLGYRFLRAGLVKEAYFEYAKIFRSLPGTPMKVCFVFILNFLFVFRRFELRCILSAPIAFPLSRCSAFQLFPQLQQ